jgi:hypothetical protein
MAEKKTNAKKATKKKQSPGKAAASKKAAAPKAATKATPKEESLDEAPLNQAAAVEKDSRVQRLLDMAKGRKKQCGIGAGIVLLLVLLWMVPATKYGALNLVSEADASISIVDSETGQPVTGAEVRLSSGDVATTDEEGVAFFNDASYGQTTATISKDAYETLSVDVTISKDDIVLGPFEFVSTGVPVNVAAIDWLTEEPITDFKVQDESGESSFKSQDGVAILNVPPNNADDQTYSVVADGYNAGSLVLDLSKAGAGIVPEPGTVKLVRDGEHTFLSNRDGTINFYRTDFNGENTALLLETGEKESLNLWTVPDSQDHYVLLLSSDKHPWQQDQLAYISLANPDLNIVDDAIGEDVNFGIISVDNERVVYRVTYNDGRDNAYRIKSYEFASGALQTHYKGNASPSIVYDNDTNVFVMQFRREERGINNQTPVRKITYHLSRTVLPDGEREILSERETDILRRSPNNPDAFMYRFNVRNAAHRVGYYEIDFVGGEFPGRWLGEDYPKQEVAEETPDSEKGLASPEGTNRAWIDYRDGKGRIIVNESTNTINKTGNLSAFSIIRWVDETTLTVSGSDGTETADYIVDIESGNYQKITNSFRQSYYDYY